MPKASRRRFLQHVGAATALASCTGPLAARTALQSTGLPQAAPMGRVSTPRAIGLLIKGGRVIDPAQRIDAVMDVAVKDAKIARVATGIPTSEASGVFDATGKIVTPGLIDAHAHVYDSGIPLSIDPDVVGIPRGVTTIVDGGSAGSAGFAGFRRYVIERAQTRVCAILNIGINGCCSDELYGDLRLVDPRTTIATIEQNRSPILGIKVRIHGQHGDLARDVEVLRLAREAADVTGLPIMMHWSNEPDLIALLKQGDILTHPYNPPRPNQSNVLGGASGKVLPIVRTLKDRGIWTDLSHGSHLDWTIAEAAVGEGWFPDVISTDVHRAHVPPSGVVRDLPTTISKFMYLGLSVERAIEKVTAAPAKMLKFPQRIGTLEPGAVADITISEIRTGEFELFDSRRAKRLARQKFVPSATVKDGSIRFWAD